MHLLRDLIALIFIAGVGQLPAAPQLVIAMTPERIEEAIRLAADEKGATRFLDTYLLQNRAGWGNGPRIGSVSTPFSRVVQVAVAAVKKGRPFTTADVGPALILPEFHVVATAQKAASDDMFVNVHSVVLAPSDSNGAPDVIQPIRISELNTDYQRLHGTDFEANGIVAIFSLSSVLLNSAVRITFEQTVRGSSAMSRCRECIVPLNVYRVR